MLASVYSYDLIEKKRVPYKELCYEFALINVGELLKDISVDVWWEGSLLF